MKNCIEPGCERPVSSRNTRCAPCRWQRDKRRPMKAPEVPPGHCRCGQRVLKMPTVSGEWVLINPQPDVEGNVVLTEGVLTRQQRSWTRATRLTAVALAPYMLAALPDLIRYRLHAETCTAVKRPRDYMGDVRGWRKSA